MFGSHRGTGFTIVTGISATLFFILFVVAVYKTGGSTAVSQYKNSQHTHQYAADAEKEIEKTCLLLKGGAMAKCITEIIEATNEHNRDEDDRIAQGEMALWAFWMAVISGFTVLTAVSGIYYVRQTLMETRRIGQSQVRAYFSDPKVEFEWKEEATDSGFVVWSKWKNVGQTPAVKIATYSDVKIIDYESDWDAIEDFICPKEKTITGTAISPPNGSFKARVAEFDSEARESLYARDKSLLIYNMLCFEDVFGRVHHHESCSAAVFPLENEPDGIKFQHYPHHNGQTI